MLQGEFSLSSVSRIGLSEDGVTVTWDDLSTLQCRPNVLGDLLVGSIFTDLGSHLLDPSEDLLVSETVYQRVFSMGRDDGETHPWRGPARPLREAAKERKGSERADPTKCPVWAYLSETSPSKIGVHVQRRYHPRGQSGW
jgi:hypothetical protein